MKVYRDYLEIEKGYEDVLFLNKRGTALSRVMVFNIIKHLATVPESRKMCLLILSVILLLLIW